ncbi:hypothetical protein N7466_000239 [Penicillium verhagenii]|uniref:uncharacterized protein n=1 Tax=Penicillium verhagenii TaxID=1562060 RepID=UPI0025455AE1|nr:uncharacterized protein N7466_000239 [Penicillium verhagenii]KAJ5947224.1 hypothetical protein N7466_000239 [Penicillium verhagenii]
MIEAQTRRADWSDIDVDTFTRLCEFAYLKDYQPPSYHPIKHWPPPPDAVEVARKKKKSVHSELMAKWRSARRREKLHFGDYSPPRHVQSSYFELPLEERGGLGQKLRDSFKGNPSFTPPPTGYSAHNFAPPKNTWFWQDFTAVLVEQARLYVLADKYGIESLCKLVLFKLVVTLRSFKLYHTGVDGVVELVRFVYNNTRPDYGNNVDPLRKLVVRYVVSVIGQIGEQRAFKQLLNEGGDFVTDFWQIFWSLNGDT